jgi:hypothetical protein
MGDFLKKRSEKCGCVWINNVQAIACGEHNVAAKNLDRAQVLIVQGNIERDILQKRITFLEALTSKGPEPSLAEKDFDQKVAWASGVILNGIGEGNLRGAVATILVHVNNEAYQRGKRDGENSSRKKKSK